MSFTRVFVALLGFRALAYGVHAQAQAQCVSQSRYAVSHHQSPFQLDVCLDRDVSQEPVEIEESFEHPVWSHEPFCIGGKKKKKYCTHTTPSLRDGNGLSIIAVPAAAEAISSTFTASREARHVPEDGLEVQVIPGKGKGLITTRPIAEGETILLDSPRMVASAQFPSLVTRTEGQSLFNTALKHLPQADQDRVSSLDQSLGGSAIENIVKTNAFACQISDGGVDDGYMCLFPSVARINHACRPNAYARFIPKTLLMEIKALGNIEAGEEINISYGKIELKHAERQKLYKEGWNFTCTCTLCTAAQYEIEGSDQRRARFAQLRKKLETLTAETYDAQQIVSWEKEVMEISKKEGLDILLAQDYERLAYVYAGHGMVRDARVWAEKAKESLLEWVVVEGGPDNEIQRIMELLGELNG